MNDVKKLKIAFALIAVISAIIIAMPNTISLFGGQHGWYGLGPVGSDVPCEKCHGDIVAEMNSVWDLIWVKQGLEEWNVNTVIE